MKLSEQNRITLLTQLHRSIEYSANMIANNINDGQTSDLIYYPPNGGLTEEEMNSLKSLVGNEVLRNALRKVFASNSATVLFELFNIIDGTSDPDPEFGEWSEVLLIDRPDNFDDYYEFLHDNFYETYWNWRKQRVANYKLDLLDD